MATRQAELILRHLQTVMSPQGAEQYSDRELLGRFARQHDEDGLDWPGPCLCSQAARRSRNQRGGFSGDDPCVALGIGFPSLFCGLVLLALVGRMAFIRVAASIKR